MKNILRICGLAVIAMALFCVSASAQQVNLSYGTGNVIELIENQADQRVDFFVNNIGGKNYDTFEFWMQIGDGGSPIGGTDTGPGLSGVDLGNVGTIFEGGTRGTFGPGNQTPLLWADFIDGVVATNDGIGGTLIFDTTGFFAGTEIDILFENIQIGATTFNTNFRDGGSADPVENVAASSNGLIRVVAVPEPSSAAVLLALAGMIGVRRRR